MISQAQDVVGLLWIKCG